MIAAHCAGCGELKTVAYKEVSLVGEKYFCKRCGDEVNNIKPKSSLMNVKCFLFVNGRWVKT